MSTISFQEAASKILDAGAIGVGKAYLSKPSTGSVEYLPFTRAGSGSTTMQYGLIVEQAANLPAIVKREGECPRIRFRQAQTRLFTQPNNLAHTDWVKTAIGTGVAPIATASFAEDPMGGNDACRVQFNTGAGGTSGDQSYIRQAASLVSGSPYTMGFWLKSNTGGDQSIQFLRESGNLVTVVVTDEWQFFPTTKTAASTGASNWGLFLNGSTATTADVLVFAANMVLGTYIPDVILGNDTGTQTRNTDSISETGLKAKGFIGSAMGTIGGEFSASSLIGESTGFMLTLGSGGGEYLGFRRLGGASASRISIVVGKGGLPISTNLTTQDQNRWIFGWDATGWYLSINGTTVASGSDVISFSSDSISMTGNHGLWELSELPFATFKLPEANANLYTTA